MDSTFNNLADFSSIFQAECLPYPSKQFSASYFQIMLSLLKNFPDEKIVAERVARTKKIFCRTIFGLWRKNEPR
jgi:hypothetical protein